MNRREIIERIESADSGRPVKEILQVELKQRSMSDIALMFGVGFRWIELLSIEFGLATKLGPISQPDIVIKKTGVNSSTVRTSQPKNKRLSCIDQGMEEVEDELEFSSFLSSLSPEDDEQQTINKILGDGKLDLKSPDKPQQDSRDSIDSADREYICDVQNTDVLKGAEFLKVWLEWDQLRNQVDKSEAQAAQEVRLLQQMIEGNLRLVLSVARKFRYRSPSLSIGDLIGFGSCVGLKRAIEKFKPSKGFAFSTYATWWVKRSIIRYQNGIEYPVRLPNNKVEELRKIGRVETNLKQQLGQPPTREQLAQGLSEFYPKGNWSLKKLGVILEARAIQPFGFEDLIGSGSDYDEEPGDPLERLAVAQEAKHEDAFEFNIQKAADEKIIQQLFTGLSWIEFVVVFWRVAVNKNLLDSVRFEQIAAEFEYPPVKIAEVVALVSARENWTKIILEDIGIWFSLSRERIRQVQARVTKRILRPRLARILRSYTSRTTLERRVLEKFDAQQSLGK